MYVKLKTNDVDLLSVTALSTFLAITCISLSLSVSLCKYIYIHIYVCASTSGHIL